MRAVLSPEPLARRSRLGFQAQINTSLSWPRKTVALDAAGVGAAGAAVVGVEPAVAAVVAFGAGAIGVTLLEELGAVLAATPDVASFEAAVLLLHPLFEEDDVASSTAVVVVVAAVVAAVLLATALFEAFADPAAALLVLPSVSVLSALAAAVPVAVTPLLDWAADAVKVVSVFTSALIFAPAVEADELLALVVSLVADFPDSVLMGGFVNLISGITASIRLKPSIGRPISPFSPTLHSTSVYISPFCKIVRRAAGGTRAPLMLLCEIHRKL
uniref:Uncharacterized protein n=1 Tax=Glossina brevipalpis TaxID=37001 RepID=A0A1A9WUR8_9MUSC